jgi:peptide-methionine (S)-S-oxide reductase
MSFFGAFSRGKLEIPKAADALPHRVREIPVNPRHAVLGTSTRPPWPEGLELALFGLGCFWGAERKFWQHEGVHSTQVGYAGGHTQNASYEDVCSGRTGHAEVVRVVFDPKKTSYDALLRLFWESHDPTQGMRQGNDVGTQYRSAIYAFDAGQRAAAEASRRTYGARLRAAGLGEITTEIGVAEAAGFFYAEDYHQQYLHKNPGGYCGLGGTGVICPVGLPAT